MTLDDIATRHGVLTLLMPVYCIRGQFERAWTDAGTATQARHEVEALHRMDGSRHDIAYRLHSFGPQETPVELARWPAVADTDDLRSMGSLTVKEIIASRRRKPLSVSDGCLPPGGTGPAWAAVYAPHEPFGGDPEYYIVAHRSAEPVP